MTDVCTETDEAVIDTVAEEFGIPPTQIDAEARLMKDIGLDSIDRLGLAVCLEERFGIAVKDESINRARTMGDVMELVAIECASSPSLTSREPLP